MCGVSNDAGCWSHELPKTGRGLYGYVAKIHDNPNDKEYEDYAGTIDVGEFPDETHSSAPIMHKGVMLCGLKHNTNGLLIVPTLYSDVTIVMDAGTNYTYVSNYSHADIIQIDPHHEVSVGASETELMDLSDNDSPDYDQLKKTGNSSKTTYTPIEIVTIVEDKRKNEWAKETWNTTSVKREMGDTVYNQTAELIEYSVGDTSILIKDGKIFIGANGATEPMVLGNQLATLMQDFLSECSQIKTVTMLGTMPAINFPNFNALMAKIESFKSKITFVK